MENNEKRSNEIINSVESHQWIFNLYMKTWGKSDFPWWWLSSNRWLDNFKKENTHFQIKYPATQEARVRTGHGTTDWFQIGKGVHQGCIL